MLYGHCWNYPQQDLLDDSNPMNFLTLILSLSLDRYSISSFSFQQFSIEWSVSLWNLQHWDLSHLELFCYLGQHIMCQRSNCIRKASLIALRGVKVWKPYPRRMRIMSLVFLLCFFSGLNLLLLWHMGSSLPSCFYSSTS